MTPSRIGRSYTGIFLLSTATLVFEINLTRLFAVAQFYHFAFMIVSIALLGFGASGTALAIFPKIKHWPTLQSLGWLSLAAGFTTLGSYMLINQMPFDSFSIAWDRRQVVVLVLHYLALSTPFFCSGLAVGLLLLVHSEKAGQIYAANLAGSSLGCLLALFSPGFVAGEGTVILACELSAIAALVCLAPDLRSLFRGPAASDVKKHADGAAWRRLSVLGVASWKFFGVFALIALLTFSFADLISRALGESPFHWLDLRISPYKGLSYALQYPNAESVFQHWNSFSRVDVVRSEGIRSLPGLSYRYSQIPPAQDGMLVDGDDLSPVARSTENLDFTAFLPSRIASQLRPAGNVLVLEPGGGLDILTALAGGAGHITAVEANPLVIQAARGIYEHTRVSAIHDYGRSFTRLTQEKYDLVIISLVNSFHPVRSGAYSLAENYRYTVESFGDALDCLEPDGILVVTRWIQSPPSESLRTFAIAMTALELRGGNAQKQITAFRGYNTITFLIMKRGFSQVELRQIREFTSRMAYDLVISPDIRLEETNRFNILPEPEDYLVFKELLQAEDRGAFYRAYPFAVDPPTDDRPFFGHHFKWSQASLVFAELGKNWQPFGGAGYFVLVALLSMAISLSGLVIILPMLVFRMRSKKKRGVDVIPPNESLPLRYVFYFGLLGLAFLLVEIPLIQSFILYLGNPAYAFALVLFTLLLSSGIGSQISSHIRLIPALGLLVLMLVFLQIVLQPLKNLTLGLPAAMRMLLVMISLAPLGVFMGMAFPGGIRWTQNHIQTYDWIPWIWGINGAASVISAIAAALLSLSFGFSWVLRLGTMCYVAAWLIVMVSEWRSTVGGPPR